MDRAEVVGKGAVSRLWGRGGGRNGGGGCMGRLGWQDHRMSSRWGTRKRNASQAPKSVVHIAHSEPMALTLWHTRTGHCRQRWHAASHLAATCLELDVIEAALLRQLCATLYLVGRQRDACGHDRGACVGDHCMAGDRCRLGTRYAAEGRGTTKSSSQPASQPTTLHHLPVSVPRPASVRAIHLPPETWPTHAPCTLACGNLAAR